MPISEDVSESWIAEVGASASPEEGRWEENFIKLVSRSALNTKIMELGDFPRVMIDVKDREENVLVRKYDQLNKQVWQRLRARGDAPEIYFVCEKPLRVVEGFNLEFFNYEDYQFIGAYLAEKGKQKSAGWILSEALKSETADAFINKGVYHYRASATGGVFDHYRLAKKHFEKGEGLLRRMNFLPADERVRRKICAEAVDEIDYKSSSGLARIFKALLRLLSMRFEREVFYVGAANLKSRENSETLRLIVSTIERYELQMLKESAENFIYSLKLEVPEGSEDLSLSLDGIANQIRAAQREPEIVEYARTLGEIHARTTQATTRRDKVVEAAKREAETSLLDRLTTDEKAQIARLDAVNSLRSPRELADMAARKDIDRTCILWLYKERPHIKMIVEALFQNPAVPEDLKKEIERRFGFGSKIRNP